MKPFPLTPYPELIVNFCPTGMIPTKAMTPHIPISPEEVIEDSCRALDRGAAIVHLHAREEDGTPELPGRDLRRDDPRHPGPLPGRHHLRELQRQELSRVRAPKRGPRAHRRWPGPTWRVSPSRRLDFPTGTSQNSPDMVIALAEKMVDRGIKPELECFDFGMINAANLLIGKRHAGARARGTSTCCSAPVTRCRQPPGTSSNMVEDLPPGFSSGPRPASACSSFR